MPWFSILGNYSTTIHVPKGIANTTIPFSDIAGVGRPGPGKHRYTLQIWIQGPHPPPREDQSLGRH